MIEKNEQPMETEKISVLKSMKTFMNGKIY